MRTQSNILSVGNSKTKDTTFRTRAGNRLTDNSKMYQGIKIINFGSQFGQINCKKKKIPSKTTGEMRNLFDDIKELLLII